MSRRWKIVLIVSLFTHVATIYVARKALEYRGHINEFLYKYQKVVSEFSQRQVYSQENINLGLSRSEQHRLVLFGTQMIHSFPASIDISGWDIVNRGVKGQRAAGLLLRFQADVVKLQPKAVLIEFNQYNFRPNSSVDELQEYYLSIAQLARSNNIVPILTTVNPPRRNFHVLEHEEYSIIDSTALFSNWVRALSVREEYPLADFARTVSDSCGFIRADLSTGQSDLNSAGYDLLSEEIRKALSGIEKIL